MKIFPIAPIEFHAAATERAEFRYRHCKVELKVVLSYCSDGIGAWPVIWCNGDLVKTPEFDSKSERTMRRACMEGFFGTKRELKVLRQVLDAHLDGQGEREA